MAGTIKKLVSMEGRSSGAKSAKRDWPKAVVRQWYSCHSSGYGGYDLPGDDSRLCVQITLFSVPGTEDRGQLPLELLFGDLPIPEGITKVPDPNLCIGQGFKGSVSPSS